MAFMGNSGLLRRRLVLILAALLFLPCLGFSEVPRGVFCLLPAGSGAGNDPAVYSNPNVDGISVRQHWRDLEPAEGAFNFTYLDTVVAKAAGGGQKVLRRIGTSGGTASKGGMTPDWVFDAIQAEPLPSSQKFFTWDDDGVMRTIPVFWDPVYLAKKKAMITALGAHFGHNPAVEIVSASFANAQTEDWAVPHTSVNVTNWLAAGYTSDKMLDAGRQIINTTMAAFPNQYVCLAVGENGHTSGVNLDPDRDYVARNAVLTARASWPGRLIVQKDTLAAFTPPAPGTDTVYQIMWDSTPDIGAQMLWFCYGDSTYRMNRGVPINPSTALTQSVNRGLAYGVKYIEIYRPDILNLPTAAKYAHDALSPSPPTDFNGDGNPDYVLYNAAASQTVFWFLRNNVFLSGYAGPTLPANWRIAGVADFNQDGHPDFALFNQNTLQTVIWYFSGPKLLSGAAGPTLPSGWQLVATADFNSDGNPDYVLYNPSTGQTAFWFLRNNVFLSSYAGPTLPANWRIAGVADCNQDGQPDFALFNQNTLQTVIWYFSGPKLLSGAAGPTLPSGWQLVGTADFNGDGRPDYVLYNAGTRQTVLRYMNNNVHISDALGPTLPTGWILARP